MFLFLDFGCVRVVDPQIEMLARQEQMNPRTQTSTSAKTDHCFFCSKDTYLAAAIFTVDFANSDSF